MKTNNFPFSRQHDNLKTKNKVANLTASMIDNQYKFTSQRDRQISATILKCSSSSKLFYMYNQLIKKKNYNTTHLVMIFARLIDIDMFLYKTTPNKRIQLGDKTLFYRILSQIEANIDRMLQETILLLLRKIIHFNFLRIDYTTIVISVCNHLISDDNLSVMEKGSLFRCYFYIVRLSKLPNFKNIEIIKDVAWKLIKETQRVVVSRAMSTSDYFQLAKYHYYFQMMVHKRMVILNKELTLRKKYASFRHLYYWFIFNSQTDKCQDEMLIILTEILNREAYKGFGLNRGSIFGQILLKINLENVQLLKKVLLEKTMDEMVSIVIKSVDENEKMKKFDRFINFLSVYPREVPLIHDSFKKILIKGILEPIDEIKLLSYFLQRSIPLESKDLQIIIDRGCYTGINLNYLIDLYKQLADKNLDISLFKLQKRMTKVFIRRFYFYPKETIEIRDLFVQIFKSEPLAFTFYLFYVNRVLRKMEVVNSEFAELEMENDDLENEKKVKKELEDSVEIGIVKGNRFIIFHLSFLDETYDVFQSSENEKILLDVISQIEMKLIINRMNDDTFTRLAKIYADCKTPILKDLLNRIHSKVTSFVEKAGEDEEQ